MIFIISLSTTDQKALSMCGYKWGFQTQVYWLISTWWLDGSILALKAGFPPDCYSLGYCPFYTQVRRFHWLHPTLRRVLLETMPKPISMDPQRILPWLGTGLCNSHRVEPPPRPRSRKPLQHFNKPQSPELKGVSQSEERKACKVKVPIFRRDPPTSSNSGSRKDIFPQDSLSKKEVSKYNP